MSDDAKKKEPAPAKKDDKAAPADAHGEKSKGGGLLTKMPVLLGGAMIIEAAVLFAGFKFLAGGKPAAAPGAEVVSAEGHAADGHGEEKAGGDDHGKTDDHGAKAGDHGAAGPAPVKDKKAPCEVPLVEIKAQNTVSGRMYVYDVKIVVSTRGEFEEKVKTKIKDRQSLINDRVQTIIAQSDPEKLPGGAEPGLETLRRQIKRQLDEIVGEKLIDEILFDRKTRFRGD